MRVLGVDPGLTRCGVGVVEGVPGRPCSWSPSTCLRTTADADLADRLLHLDRAGSTTGRRAPAGRGRRGAGVQPAQRPHRDGHRPGRRGRGRWPPRGPGCRCAPTRRARSRPPSPAPARPTRPRSPRWSPGCCGCDAPPRPADAADALALAICHIWRGGAARPSCRDAAGPAGEGGGSTMIASVRGDGGLASRPTAPWSRSAASGCAVLLRARHARRAARSATRPGWPPAWSCARTR